jgi:hypothetical protein
MTNGHTGMPRAKMSLKRCHLQGGDNVSGIVVTHLERKTFAQREICTTRKDSPDNAPGFAPWNQESADYVKNQRQNSQFSLLHSGIIRFIQG